MLVSTTTVVDSIEGAGVGSADGVVSSAEVGATIIIIAAARARNPRRENIFTRT